MENKQEILESCLEFILTHDKPVPKKQLAKLFHEANGIEASDAYVGNNIPRFLEMLTSSDKYSVEQIVKFLFVTKTKLPETNKKLLNLIENEARTTFDNQMYVVNYKDDSGNMRFGTSQPVNGKRRGRKELPAAKKRVLIEIIDFTLDLTSERPLPQKELTRKFLKKSGLNLSEAHVHNNIRKFLEILTTSDDYTGEQKARFVYLTSSQITDEYEVLKEQIEEDANVEWNSNFQITRYTNKDGEVKFEGDHLTKIGSRFGNEQDDSLDRIKVLKEIIKFTIDMKSSVPVPKKHICVEYNKLKGARLLCFTHISANINDILRLLEAATEYTGEQKAYFLFIISETIPAKYQKLEKEVNDSGIVTWNEAKRIIRYEDIHGVLKFEGKHNKHNGVTKKSALNGQLKIKQTTSKKQSAWDSEFDDTDSELNFKPEYRKVVQKKRKAETENESENESEDETRKKTIQKKTQAPKTRRLQDKSEESEESDEEDDLVQMTRNMTLKRRKSNENEEDSTEKTKATGAQNMEKASEQSLEPVSEESSESSSDSESDSEFTDSESEELFNFKVQANEHFTNVFKIMTAHGFPGNESQFERDAIFENLLKEEIKKDYPSAPISEIKGIWAREMNLFHSTVANSTEGNEESNNED